MTGTKEGACWDEHWVLYVSDELLGSTLGNNTTLYVNLLEFKENLGKKITGPDWPGLSHLLHSGNEADMGLGPWTYAFSSSYFFQFLDPCLCLQSVPSFPASHLILAPGKKWPRCLEQSSGLTWTSMLAQSRPQNWLRRCQFR